MRPACGIVRQPHRSAPQRPDGLVVAEKQNDERVALGQQQAQDENAAPAPPSDCGIAKELEYLRDAPVSVPKVQNVDSIIRVSVTR